MCARVRKEKKKKKGELYLLLLFCFFIPFASVVSLYLLSYRPAPVRLAPGWKSGRGRTTFVCVFLGNGLVDSCVSPSFDCCMPESRRRGWFALVQARGWLRVLAAVVRYSCLSGEAFSTLECRVSSPDDTVAMFSAIRPWLAASLYWRALVAAPDTEMACTAVPSFTVNIGRCHSRVCAT